MTPPLKLQYPILRMDTGQCVIGQNYCSDARFFRKCFGGYTKPGMNFHLFRRMLLRLSDYMEIDREILLKKAEPLSIDADGKISWPEFKRVFEFDVRLSFLERVFLTFDDPSCSILSFSFSLVILTLILVSCGTLILESLDSYRQDPEYPWSLCIGHAVGSRPSSCEEETAPLPIFKTVETVCIFFFTIEYVVRLATVHGCRRGLVCNANSLIEILCDDSALTSDRARIAEQRRVEKLPRRNSGFRKTVKFFLNSWNIIDLCAIAPWYVKQFGGEVPRFVAVLRALRLTRLLKLSTYNEVLQITDRVINDSVHPLCVLGFNLVLGIVVSGSLMYYAEIGEWSPPGPRWPYGAYLRIVRPVLTIDISTGQYALEPSPFVSIPVACWWVVVTITTCGYGDMWPTSPLGCSVAALTVVCGLIVLAMPIGVIGSNFSNGLHLFKEAKQLVRTEYENERRKNHEGSHSESGFFDSENDGAFPEDTEDTCEIDDAAERERLRLEVLDVFEAIQKLCREQQPRLPAKCAPPTLYISADLASSKDVDAVKVYSRACSNSECGTPTDADISAGEPVLEFPDDCPESGVFVPPSRAARGCGSGEDIDTNAGAFLSAKCALLSDCPLELPKSSHVPGTRNDHVCSEWRRVRGLVEGPLVASLPEAAQEIMMAQMYAAGLRVKVTGR